MMEAATRSPLTMTAVRLMSSSRWTPIINTIPAVGIPAVSSTMARITIPTPGVPGEPIEAPTANYLHQILGCGHG